jgi:hypothetical protein
MKLSTVTKIVLMVVFFFSMSSAFAQLPEDPDDASDPVDGPLDPAPINDYLIPMFVLGAATAFILIKKKTPARL